MPSILQAVNNKLRVSTKQITREISSSTVRKLYLNRDFLRKIMFTDETCFTADGASIINLGFCLMSAQAPKLFTQQLKRATG